MGQAANEKKIKVRGPDLLYGKTVSDDTPQCPSLHAWTFYHHFAIFSSKKCPEKEVKKMAKTEAKKRNTFYKFLMTISAKIFFLHQFNISVSVVKTEK